MADEPNSTTVSETVTVDTGADKESIESLNANFEDFWKETDAKSDDAPAAPGAGQETKAEPKSHPEISAPETRAEQPTHGKEYSDDDIDKMGMPSNFEARPEVHQQFRDVKELWKADRARMKAEADRAAKLEQDLNQARQNSWTPEQKADYEHAASVRRKFDVASDPEFIRQFQEPIRNHYHDVLSEAVQALPDRQAAAAWADYIAKNYTPDQLDKNWWNHSVIDKIPDETDQATVRQSVANLLKAQKERDAEVTRRSNDKSAYDNWIKERDLSRAKQVEKEVMDEIGIQEQKLKEVLRKDPAQAKTNEEREAIEKHNERFEKLNGYFQDTMKDLTFNGSRAMVRAAVEATRALYIEGEYKEMEKRAKSAEAERDQYKTELDKITGARRKISHTTGTPPATSGSKPNGLSLKSLDVRKSFEDFDWDAKQ